MISQFVTSHRKKHLLGELNFTFPEGTHAVGRLDENSEGLLILTTDKSLTLKLLHPSQAHQRRYIVQVEKIMSDETIKQMENGVDIVTTREGDYKTKACLVKRIEKPEWLLPRHHEFRSDLPQSWLEITLFEGKNRQVRKMCAAVGHDCKRLIRSSINQLQVHHLKPGEVKEISREELFHLLF